MARIPAPARFQAAAALIIFIYSAPAPGKGHEAAPVRPGEPADECTGHRLKLRDEAVAVLDLPPGTDLRDTRNFRKVLEKYCKRSADAPVNNKNRQKGQGVCETTYVQILSLINSSDQAIARACQAIGLARKKADSCLDGQNECYRVAAGAFRQAGTQLAAARKTGATVKDLLVKQVTLHNEASGAYASHLDIIASEVEKFDLEQRVAQEMAPMTYFPPTAAVRRRVINERVRQRLNESALQVEGVNDFEKMLTDSGLDAQDPAGIRTRAAGIRRHIGSTVTGTGEVDYTSQFGPWSGEQFGARGRVQEFLPVWERTDEKLGRGETWLEQTAVKLEGNIRRADSIPNQQDPAPRPRGPAARIDQPPGQFAGGNPFALTSASSALPFFSSGASLPGAAAAPPAQRVEGPAPAGRAPASAPSRTAGRRLALSPGESASLAGAMGREVSAREKEHEEIRQAESFTGALEQPEGHGVIRAPFSASPVAGAGPAAAQGASQPSAVTSGTNETEASAGMAAPPANPNAEAFAERQVAQMEQGRRFSPSLRDQLKRRLASQFEKNKGHARAAADLFEEMRRGPGDPEAPLTEEQLAALEAQGESLFARVHSAHRRVVAKAKVAFH